MDSHASKGSTSGKWEIPRFESPLKQSCGGAGGGAPSIGAATSRGVRVDDDNGAINARQNRLGLLVHHSFVAVASIYRLGDRCISVIFRFCLVDSNA